MQATAAALSSLQVNVAPASLDEKSNDVEPLATVPDGPELIVVSGATVSTVQVAEAGVGSGLPAASVAVTVTVCGPWARLEYDFGDVHEAAAAVSSLQVKLTSGSDAPNEIAALVLGTEPDGADVIVVSGTAVSTVKLAVAGVGSVLPASSLAVTAIVCGPSSSPVYCLGEVHDCAGPPSSEQVNVEPAMLDVNDTDCVEDVTTPLGTGGVSDVWGAVNSPHGPGVGPSIRHTPPLSTFVAYGWPQASVPNELSPRPALMPSSRGVGDGSLRFVVRMWPDGFSGVWPQKNP